MVKKSKFIFALLTSTVLTQNVSALTLTPTLNSLKTEATKLTEEDKYTLTELGSNTLPEGAVKVMVDGVAYYFEPTGDNKALVSTLAGTPATVVTDDGNGGYNISFDASKLPNSAFSYVTGSETDYNFTVQEAAANGELTTKYYKIVLDKTQIGSSENISYDVVDIEPTSGKYVTLTLPNDKKVYVTYEYDDTTGRKVYNTRQENTLTGDVDADFVGSNITSTSSFAQGGAIYNQGTIGNITGDFIGNYANSTSRSAESGAIYNAERSTIGNITGDFIGNYVLSSTSSAGGGAIYNDYAGTIGNITGDFIGNYTMTTGTSSYAKGGAIFNWRGTISNITGDFTQNYASSTSYSALGGAIYNDYGSIGNIIGDFIENYASGSSYVYGGAIYNNNTIGDITGDFIGNYADARSNVTRGGAIANNDAGTIGNIIGDFIENYASGSSYVYGGAISNSNSISNTNSNSTIGNITGDFIGNYANNSSSEAYGGAIYNTSSSTIGNITGDFIGNYASGKYYAGGGAIYNISTIGNITGDFIGNYAKADSSSYLASGGAVYTTKGMTFTSGADAHLFSGNYTSDTKRGKNYNAIYIYNSSSSTKPVITFDTTGGGSWTINDNIEGGYDDYFVDYTYKYDLSFIGDDTVAEDGTTTQYVSMNNAIINAENVTVDGTTLKFGSYTHEDQTAKNYQGQGKFIASLNKDGTENLTAASVTSLMLNNAVFDVANGYIDNIYLKGFSSNNSFYHVDVDVENKKADVLYIDGDVKGTTNVIVHASSDVDIRGNSILFVHSTNDTTGTKDSFKVSRVYGSPYLYDVLFNVAQNSDDTATVANTNENKWYLGIDEGNDDGDDSGNTGGDGDNTGGDDDDTGGDGGNTGGNTGGDDDDNTGDNTGGNDDNTGGNTGGGDDDGDNTGGNGDNTGGNTGGSTGGVIVQKPILVAPEIIGGISLPTVAITQKVGMISAIMRKVGVSHLYSPECEFCSYTWDGKPNYNAWVDTDYTDLSITSPVDIDAKVWGIEAGFDLQHDRNNKLGVFVSYRMGDYDINGNGKEYYSTKSSEIEAKSYLGGLYYHHDKNNFYTFATIFGGIQKAELETSDGFKADTDGVELGASLELGYKYALSKTLYLEPSVSATYDQVSYDDAKDNVGKKYEYEDIKQLELELGAKLGKSAYLPNGYYNVYVKPSIVQTYNDGDEVKISQLDTIDTLEDQTLGRVEIGGNYGIGDNWSLYGWTNHTFGDDYKATSLGLGLNYNW